MRLDISGTNGRMGVTQKYRTALSHCDHETFYIYFYTLSRDGSTTRSSTASALPATTVRLHLPVAPLSRRNAGAATDATFAISTHRRTTNEH